MENMYIIRIYIKGKLIYPYKMIWTFGWLDWGYVVSSIGYVNWRAHTHTLAIKRSREKKHSFTLIIIKENFRLLLIREYILWYIYDDYFFLLYSWLCIYIRKVYVVGKLWLMNKFLHSFCEWLYENTY